MELNDQEIAKLKEAEPQLRQFIQVKNKSVHSLEGIKGEEHKVLPTWLVDILPIVLKLVETYIGSPSPPTQNPITR